MSAKEPPSLRTSAPKGIYHHQRPFVSAHTTHVVDSRRLVLGSASLGELKGNTTAGELAVDLGVGVEAVVDTTTLLLVEDDLEGLGAVLLGAEALANNLDGEDEVGQNGIVNGGQSAGAGALLGGGVARAGGALGAGKDAARGEDQNVAVRELLLELAGQAALGVRYSGRGLRAKGRKLTAAGRGGSPAGTGRGQRWQSPSCRGQPRSIFKITKSACELPDSLFGENRVRGPLPVLFHVVSSVSVVDRALWDCVRARKSDRFRSRSHLFSSLAVEVLFS